MPEAPDQPPLFGNHQLLSMIGRGGMAEVFRARVLSGPRKDWLVAIKRLLPALSEDAESREQFAQEAALCKLLDHVNIVRIFDAGTVGRSSFIEMELIDGRDLGRVLRRCKQASLPLPVDFAVFLAKTLLEALDHAHNVQAPDGRGLNLIHCDVSPSNLFISRTGEIKLGDFGVARIGANLVNLQTVVGKPYYLSPEVIAGELTAEADLWAAAVSLYELLTLERPFTGKTPDQVFAAVAARDYVPVQQRRPEVSDSLAGVIARGFAMERTERFANAAQFAAALSPHYDERIGTPLAIAAVVRGLFGAEANT